MQKSLNKIRKKEGIIGNQKGFAWDTSSNIQPMFPHSGIVSPSTELKV